VYRVKQLDAREDLSGFSRWLSWQGVAHRITEENGHQVLWLENQEYAEVVLEALEQYLDEPDKSARFEVGDEPSAFVRGRWQPSPRHAPLVFGMILLAVIMVLLTAMGTNEVAAALMFIDPRHYDWSSLSGRLGALSASLGDGQIWRLLTPDFLHFSWSHILFNSVMLWFLGSQVEWFDGRGRLLVLFLGTSIFSNGLQYLVSGPLFGGLSGVVYGILGYCWLSQYRSPRFLFPPALVTFSVVWMVIGFTPLTSILGMGQMANEAHVGGFLSGVALAAILPVRES